MEYISRSYNNTAHILIHISNFFQVPVTKSSTANHSAYSSPFPLVVNVEPGFRSSNSHSMTFSLKNYDGSETHKILNSDRGCETVTEMTLGSDGRLLGKIYRRGKISLEKE